MIISHVPDYHNTVHTRNLLLYFCEVIQVFLYNKHNNTGLLENMKYISHVEQDISLLCLLTPEISWSTPEINIFYSCIYNLVTQSHALILKQNSSTCM